LANLTLEIMHFENRSATDSVKNWYIGHMFDCDNGGDTVAIDRNISTAWTYNQPGADQALGSIKIPFGCGDASNGDWDFNPVINVKGLYGDAAFWNGTAYYDSAYIYLSNPPGLYSQNMGAGDAEAHFTLAGHNFGPSGTYSMGVANFLIHGLTDASSSAELASTANFVNKWAGFGRGDVNNDGKIDLADIIYLAAYINNGGPGPVPFQHLGDVNADGNTDAADITYLMDYYFQCGPCPMGAWIF
ncbi:MAG: hypothetical protein GXO93_05020, partial [FCB group bacterium]|nr:hypothetical protein [FCB group bacterium]